MRRVLPAPLVHHRQGNPVQHDEPVVSVLDVLPWHDEHRRIQGGYRHFPFPAKVADLAVAATGVDPEQRHLGQVCGQLLEQAVLLLPTQRVRLPLVGVGQQLDLRSRMQPGQAEFVDPLGRSEIQNSAHNLQSVVDRTHGGACLAPVFDPWLQGPDVDLIKGDAADPGHQELQSPNVTGNAALVLILQHELGSSLLESPPRPDAVDLCLPGLLDQSREVAFRFFESICASALANSPSTDVLIDVPDAMAFDEPRCSLASHDWSPLG